MAFTPQVVAEHLFQQGYFGVGKTFFKEAELRHSDSLKASFVRMHAVLKSVRTARCSTHRKPPSSHAWLCLS